MVLSGHATQAAADDSPSSELYVSRSQGVQMTEPSLAANVPRGQGSQLVALWLAMEPFAQGSQLEPSTEVVPAGQGRHRVMRLLGAVPGKQGWHSEEPAKGATMPTSQESHWSCSWDGSVPR